MQDALRVRPHPIKLFVVRYKKLIPKHFKTRVAGFYGVKVQERMVGNSASLSAEWVTGPDAMAVFEPVDRRGTQIAFIPDDVFYHNRMMLACQKEWWPFIEELQVGVGDSVPASEVVAQLECTRQVTHCLVPTFALVDRQGKHREYFATREEAMLAANEEVPVLRKGGAVQHKVLRFPGCVAKEIKVEAMRPEIIDLQRRFAGLPRGWTDPNANPEFRRLVIEPADKLFAKRAGMRTEDVTMGGAIMQQSEISKMVARQVSSALAGCGLDDQTLRDLRIATMNGVEESGAIEEIVSQSEEQVSMAGDNTPMDELPMPSVEGEVEEVEENDIPEEVTEQVVPEDDTNPEDAFASTPDDVPADGGDPAQDIPPAVSESKLKRMSKGAINELAEQYGFATTGMEKETMVALVLKAQSELRPEEVA